MLFEGNKMATLVLIVAICVGLLFAGLFITTCINAASEDFKNKKNKQETKGDIP